ncbi:suppressor of fused domain protein [Microbispora sp. SCL1-1]|uniref:suppressor of fused domain protein n=1 Tax=unclassified Microbispora TaxID=2614687 RepID=UPI001158681C|nr:MULTISPECIES: suppressor of fused domain protein [unclassified Microbispora]NJP30117.1 suppressor of fused domain protein [Microbispora sp. CL1-1]TQS02804.1 suppressor of fused domain protein [Microbispora sp. SCL1-1]
MANGNLNSFPDDVAAFFGDRPIRAIKTFPGPISTVIPEFQVLEVAPRRTGDAWIYISDGARSIPGFEGEILEFVLMAPYRDDVNAEILAMVSHFHADPRYLVHEGRVLNIGRPWLSGSHLSSLFVSLPYPFGPRFEYIQNAEDGVRILWLLPITESEARLIATRGIEEFERRMESKAVDILDPKRESIV